MVRGESLGISLLNIYLETSFSEVIKRTKFVNSVDAIHGF